MKVKKPKLFIGNIVKLLGSSWPANLVGRELKVIELDSKGNPKFEGDSSGKFWDIGREELCVQKLQQ